MRRACGAAPCANGRVVLRRTDVPWPERVALGLGMWAGLGVLACAGWAVVARGRQRRRVGDGMDDEALAHGLTVPEPETLEWAGPWPWSSRCRAVREPAVVRGPAGDMRHLGGHYGRCELAPHSQDVDHALERGMENVPRWSTRWTS
jgi:hypothetical protein